MGKLESLTQGRLVSMILGKHAHQKMEMVVHETKPQDLGEIDPGKVMDQPLQPVLVRTVKAVREMTW
jgi:hypothetical protein